MAAAAPARPILVPLAIALAAVALAPAASGAESEAVRTPRFGGSRLAVSADGSAAWLLSSEGAPAPLGASGPLAAPAWASSIGPLAGIALSRDGSVLYAIRPAGDGRGTELIGVAISTGQAAGRWELRWRGVYLAASADGSRLCVITVRPGLRSGESGEDWALTVVAPDTGVVQGPLVMGVAPLGAAMLRDTGGSPAGRLFVPARDRIATFTLDPPRSSWHYRSPGDNLVVADAGRPGAIWVLRDESLIEIDPGRRPRVEGRVALTLDDATTTVQLPAAGIDLTPTNAGRAVAVLLADGRRAAWVHPASARIIDTVAFDASWDALAARSTATAGRPLLVSSARMSTLPLPGIDPVKLAEPVAEAGPAHAAPQSAAPPAAVPPAGEPASQKPAPAEPTPPSNAAPEPQAGEKPPSPGKPAGEPPAQEPAPVEPPPQPPPPRPQAEQSPPPATPAPGSGPSVSGRVLGDIAAVRSVLMYGPDNILKLHALAPVAADGTFAIPLPPPGRYRLVVRAAPGAYLFTTPEFRTLVVGEGRGAQGVDGMDFEVRGRL